MSGWRVRQLTFAGPDGAGHAHSYYDIPVFDAGGGRIVAHRLTLSGRHPGPADAVEVGIVAADAPGAWTPVGESRAWSWQQGPMAQWIAGGPRLVWNDREDGRIVARLHDTETGRTRTLPGQVYAVDPAGRTALSLDMMRLDVLRPGYGYPGGAGPGPRRPAGDGVWRMDLGTGERRLILSLDRAVDFLNRRRGWGDRLRRAAGRMHYWFNHAKIAPGGTRFTVKLRWRRVGGPWTEAQGVSLTCNLDGSDLRLLAPATSHVIWLDDARLYFWQAPDLVLQADAAPEGKRIEHLAPGLVTENVHLRHLNAAGRRFVLDTPYRAEIDLLEWDRETGAIEPIATFTGHKPAKGPFRCDLHPCPSPDGRRIVVTSLQDGTRQIYLAERASA